MAVKLRLVRMGKKKQPTYRVVAADSRSPRDGRFLEIVGTYAPRGRSSTDRAAVVTIDHEKARKWLRQGAQPTERVERLLVAAGAIDGSAPEPPVTTPKATTTAAATAQAESVEQAEAAEAAEPEEGEASP